jgi:branched-subunit amino acid transport protein/MFS family permease
MTIWLIILTFGAATFGMRLAFLARTRRAHRSFSSPRWLRFVPPAVLAALVASALLPARLVMGSPLTAEKLHQLLAAGLAAFVAWHFQNVLLTVASGMGALWGLNWFPDTTITLSLPLALGLLIGVSVLVLLVSRAFPAPLLRQGRSVPSVVAARAGAVTVKPAEAQRLGAGAVSLLVPRSVETHVHCIRCWCPLPGWANFCGQCGLMQPVQVPGALPAPAREAASTALVASSVAPASDLAPTQPLVAIAVRPRRTISAFWLLWTGQTISALGSTFSLFALPLLVYRLTGSALSLGLGTTAEMLPYLCFGLLIGAWVDRLDRKRLMISIDVCQALVLSSIPLAFFFGWLTVWWIYAVSFVSASLKFCSETGQFAAIPSLVGPDEQVTATGRLQAGVSGAQMLGPILAGALLFLLPLPALLFINAATFLVSACTLLCIRRSFNASEPRHQASMRQDMLEGLRYVFGHPLLRAISIMAPLCNLLTITLVTQLPLFASMAFHASGWQISVLYTAAGAGLTVFAFLAGRLRRRLPFGKAVLGAFLLYGLLTMGLAISPWYWLAVVLWGLVQGAEMLFNVNTAALRMQIAPNHLLGRVRSVAFSIAYSVQPVGALLGGLLIARVGKGQVTLVYAGIGLVVFLIALTFCFTALGRAERYLPGGTHEPGRDSSTGQAAASRLLGVGKAREGVGQQSCPACQARMPDGAHFCGACGAVQPHASDPRCGVSEPARIAPTRPVPVAVGVEGGNNGWN